MGNVIDLRGQTFGRWKVIKENGRDNSGSVTWLCECECGTVRNVNGRSLRDGYSKSCGCLGREHRAEASVKATRKHGGRNERLYSVWRGIIQRCENPNNKFYKLYGGRGIRICDEWKEYSAFREWAISSGYNEAAPRGKCTIDRIDNDQGYFAENCRWASGRTQCNNRRSNHIIVYNGESKTLSEWARTTGIRKDTLRRRIVVYGWDIEKALTEPVHKK